MQSELRSLSVRLPSALHEASKELAEREGVSLNALIQDCLAARLRAEEERRFFDSFTELGQDLEECDVEHALAAQQEVVLRDKP